MIDYTVEGKFLWPDGDQTQPPFMRVRCAVYGPCGCKVFCGLLMHNAEQGVSWSPCETHTADKPGNPQMRFFDSLTENPMPVPVEEVIDGYLHPEYDWTPGDVIDADERGNITLDDGITTFNPVRARAHLWRA